MHILILANLETTIEIYNVPDLFYVRIKVESYRSLGPQCFSGQYFGYSSTLCAQTTRGVKCGGDHFTNICTNLREDKPKCCNCNGEHSLIYRECSYNIHLIKHKNLNTRNLETHNKSTTQLTNTLHSNLPKSKTTKTYSNVTQGIIHLHINQKIQQSNS